MTSGPPHILIIDDLFGRRVTGGRNRERENLCAKFLVNPDLDERRWQARLLRIAPLAHRPVARHRHARLRHHDGRKKEKGRRQKL